MVSLGPTCTCPWPHHFHDFLAHLNAVIPVLKYVLWGPGGVGKSTLALKFAAGQAERGGGWLRLVFRLSASSMEQDYVGLLDAMLGKIAGRAPSCTAEEVRGRVHELLQSPAWSRAWLADDLPALADDELERAGLRVSDGRVSVGAWADHHHDAGYRVGAAGGGATLRLVRRGFAHDAKVRRMPAGLLLLGRLSKGRTEQA
jgi:hypothetical protein